MITEYRIVKRCSVGELVTRVNKLLGEGWAPLGRPFVCPSGMAQAMTLAATADGAPYRV